MLPAAFAYLKELFLSSKMRWIAHPQQGAMMLMANYLPMLPASPVSCLMNVKGIM
jgi:hypothetical protein